MSDIRDGQQYTSGGAPVWVVYGEYGCFSDYSCWVESVHESRAEAEAYAQQLREAHTKSDNPYNDNSFGVVEGPWFRAGDKPRMRTSKHYECDGCGAVFELFDDVAERRCGTCHHPCPSPEK